jgi:hypothetical protein
MTNHALQYYIHDGPTGCRFELKGHLNLEAARSLDQAWRSASSAIGGRSRIVDITFITGVDKRGRALIAGWHREGAVVIANSGASRSLAESIVGDLNETPSNASAAAVSDGAFLPFHGSLLMRPAALLLLTAMVFPGEAKAATLRPETINAWDDYLQSTTANLEDQVHHGGNFLWTFDDAERAARVHSGEIVVAPADGQNPKRVIGGLIHDWRGALFIPNRKLDDILEVTRDYDHYKQFYHPSVVESKVLARHGPDDRFSILLMNKAFFLRTALDADYQATNVRLDDRRFYAISRTTRLQEVDKYGQPGEYRKPDGEGSGYIWRLYSIARLEQRDDGVYIELEAIALSRNIPAALQFAVDPVVRRVSRNSLLMSLRQTEEAVSGRFAEAARAAVIPSKTENPHGESTARR